MIITNAGGSTKPQGRRHRRGVEIGATEGRTRAAAAAGASSTSRIFYLSAWEEDQYIIAQANAQVDDNGRFTSDRVNARQAGNFILAPRDKVEFIDVAEAARVGRRLARPVPRERRREPRADGIEHAAPGGAAAPRACPYVGTGMEYITARDSRRRRGAPLGHRRLRRQPAHRRRVEGEERRRRVRWAPTSTR